MAKITVECRDGIMREVETEGDLWDFKAGDTIGYEDMAGTKFLVVGFNGNILWTREIGEPETATVSFVSPEKLFLLERPGWKFKVGDEVEITFPHKEKGTILILDPSCEGHCFIEYRDYAAPESERFQQNLWDHFWFPSNLKNFSDKRVWIPLWQIEKIPAEPLPRADFSADSGQSPETGSGPGNGAIEFLGAKGGETPEWFKNLTENHQAKISHFFILWDNINDFVKGKSGLYVPFQKFLFGAFGKRMVLTFSLSGGLEIPDPETERKIKQKILAEKQAAAGPNNQMDILNDARRNRAESNIDNMSVSELLDPAQIFIFLGGLLSEKSETKKVLIVDFAHNLVPAGSNETRNLSERVIIERFERWAKDAKIREAGNIVILLTPNLYDLAENIRSAFGAMPIRVPKPKEEERTERFRLNLLKGADAGGAASEILGRTTSGLSLVNIDEVCALSKIKNVPLAELAKSKKKEICEADFKNNELTMIEPTFGFEFVGGKENIKKYLNEIIENILKGNLRRVPMGILAAGPPGTGKTYQFLAWARECGFNVVKIVNPRSMWVGETERIMAKILAFIENMAPIIVIEDEADQSETPRGSISGDSGISNRLRQMKFAFCSRPELRGKVVWVRISNIPKLIDEAYKRKGRTDDIIPFVPEYEEYPAILKTTFEREKIPTDISDFSPFAKKLEEKIYCAPADIDSVVREADKYAAREKSEIVSEKHLYRAIDNWEMSIDADQFDEQIIAAIDMSSILLRPKNWEDIRHKAHTRLLSRRAHSEKK